MKVLILGAGRVGASLARALISNGYDIAIIDQDKSSLSELEERLDIMTVHGHASDPKIIKKSGADKNTIVIAVTSNDEVNIIACQIAKKQFKVSKTICRLNNSSYSKDLNVFGENIIDIVISPENEVMSHLKELIIHPGAQQIENFADGKVNLVCVKAKKKGKLVGRELKGIKDDMPETNAFVASIYRKGKPFVPDGDTVIRESDEVYFISSSDNIDQIVNEFREDEKEYSRIMIIGGGKIGFSLAKDLENKYKTKLIDSDKSRCAELAKKLDKTIVLNGSATDEELLKSENIANVDVFCALTDDDETNLMSSLLAKKMGAKKTMIILNLSLIHI